MPHPYTYAAETIVRAMFAETLAHIRAIGRCFRLTH